MNKCKVVIAVAVLSLMTIVADAAEEQKKVEPKVEPITLETEVQKVSYIIGSQIGTSIKGDKIDLDIEAFVRGIEDARNDRELAMTQEQMKEVMAAFQQQMMQRIQSERAAAAETNIAEGAKFLAENAKKEGVKTLPSGLQYKVIEEGTGEMPKATDTVRTHYRGTLLNGTEFDSSYARNEPAEFPVNEVIPGWTEALQLMHVGDRWQLFVPSDLAYKERGAGRDIPPNATLIFDIELLDIVENDGSIALPQQ